MKARAEFAEINTGNGRLLVPKLQILALRCLGHTSAELEVHALDFVSQTNIVGLLGFDFLQGRRLCIDYRDGTVELL